jgi:amidase
MRFSTLIIFQKIGFIFRKFSVFLVILSISIGIFISESIFAEPIKNHTIHLSASQLAGKIRSREITSEEVVKAFLEQIKLKNPSINAIVTINENAIEEAKEADRELLSGKIRGTLHGVPILVKDSYKTKGIKTTAGYLPFKDFIPEDDAVAVRLLKQSGAIIIGKGNLATLAMDMQCNNDVFGVTNNPHDLTRTPGGSSGGDAAAVASEMVPLGFGSDLAGSIRLPASFTGVYGFKPSFNVISMIGHIPPLPDEINGIHNLAVLGPIANNVNDLELAFTVLTNPNEKDKSTIPLVHLMESQKQKVNIKNLRIAWTDELGGVPVQAEIKEKVKEFVGRLKEAGAVVKKVEPTDFDYNKAWSTWGGIVGHQGGYDRSNFMRSVGDYFTSSARKGIPMQDQIVGPISVPQYMTLIGIQKELITQMDNFLQDYDMWIVPVSSTTAFKHHSWSRQFGHFNVYDKPISVDGLEVPYYTATQSYTTLFTVTENPVISMPIGVDSNQLPIGIQLVGRRYYDFQLLESAKHIEPFRILKK